MGIFGGNQYGKGPGVWELKTAQYAAAHREVWRRGFHFFLFFIDVLIICALVYVFVTFAASLPQHWAFEDSLNTTYVDFASYRATHRTLPLEVVETSLIPTGTGRADLVALVRNPNRDWAARRVPYQFIVGGIRSLPQTTYVLPGETRVIAAFRQVAHAEAALNIELGQVTWRRVDLRSLPRLEGLSAGAFRYTPFTSGATGLDFIAYNRTPYSFWLVPARIVARDAGRVVGVHQFTIEEWKSGSARVVSLSWPESLPRVTTTEVDFAVDALDPAVFLNFSGDPAPYPGF